MALIKCTECGKEFSDRASACPNCGCPAQIILEELKEKEKVKEIVATYNIGGYNFVVDVDLDFKIKLLVEVNKKKDDLLKASEKLYYGLKNIDNVIEQFPDIFSKILEGTVHGAVETLTNNGVFDCDVQQFLKKYGELLDASMIMEPIIIKYLEIQDLREEIDRYHQYLRDTHRNYWQGGGFGIGGALKGYFKAQMLNAGTAFLTSFSDNKKHTQNLQAVQKAKEVLYKDEKTKNAIIDSILQIFSICYSKVFEELENANKLKKISFQTDKAISIINNLIRYWERTNEEEFDEEFVMEQGIQAFIQDPTCKFVINSLLMLWAWLVVLDDDDLVKYAKTYDFWDEFIDIESARFIEEYKSNYNELKKLSCQPIESLEAFNKVVDSYGELEGCFDSDRLSECCVWGDVTTKLNLDSYVRISLEKYLKYDKTLNDNEFLLSLFKTEVYYEDKPDMLYYSVNTIEFFKEAIEKLKNERVIDYDRGNLVKLVERICSSHSKDYNCTEANGFYFANEYNIEWHDDIKYFKQNANLPDDCTIHLLCGKMQYNPKISKYVFAITNYGIYIYQHGTDKVEAMQLFCSWHNLGDLEFGACPDGGVYFNGELFKPYTWELIHILADLKNQVKEFLEDPRSFVAEESEENKESEEEFKDVLHISKEECINVVKEVCISFSDDHSDKIIIHSVNLFCNKTIYVIMNILNIVIRFLIYLNIKIYIIFILSLQMILVKILDKLLRLQITEFSSIGKRAKKRLLVGQLFPAII